MVNRPDYIRPARLAHVLWVSRRMRAEHAREVGETTVLSLGDAAAASFGHSVVSYTIFGGGRAVFVMGVLPAGILTAAAEVWMVGTRDIDRFPARVLRAARWGVGEAYRATGAARLEQWIPEWYETGLRFVERLGFKRRNDSGLIHVVHEKRNDGWA